MPDRVKLAIVGAGGIAQAYAKVLERSFQLLPGATFTVNGAQPAANSALVTSAAASRANSPTAPAPMAAKARCDTRGSAGHEPKRRHLEPSNYSSSAVNSE